MTFFFLRCKILSGNVLLFSQTDFERTTEKAKEAESKIQELEEQLNVVGQNMKTLELSEVNALKRHEMAEEKIR